MPTISGRQLASLLRQDGWTEGRRTTHGIFFSKLFPGERIPRTTIIPDKTIPLLRGTLGAILSGKQTGLGREGLAELASKYGMP